jgi:S-adenosylmethionine:tRNA ribosyltransferase-isomerase
MSALATIDDSPLHIDHSPLRFELTPDLHATSPPEDRGLRRDEVRLLIARPDGLVHSRFRDLPEHLAPGDLVVINTSATLPAAIEGLRRDDLNVPGSDRPVVVHFAGPHPAEDGTVVVELRRTDGQGPIEDARPEEVISLPGGAEVTLRSSYPDPQAGTGSRLWRADAHGFGNDGLDGFLATYGRPITYGYLDGRWPLDSYQPVYARRAGSAEMASAGRPFTPELITELVARGIIVAPIVLHAGVSSLEDGEAPPAERYEVPDTTARLVELTRSNGGRVVAVGTTVARALETVAAPGGRMWSGSGWTDLELGPQRRPRVVDAILTGWHEPEASHLRLLEAVAGRELVEHAYDAALAKGYLWHEFGDSCLLLP